MGFLSDVWDGFKSVPVGIYNKVIDPSLNNFNRLSGAAVNIAEGAGKGVQGLGDILSGNSNILLYAGLAIVGILVVPKLLDRIL